MRIYLFTISLFVCHLILVSAGTILSLKPGFNYRIERSTMIGCAAPLDDLIADEQGKFISVLPGLGSHDHSISSMNHSTQIYFNHGLNLYFSYHFREALASFKEAARFDPENAMAYWGQALAMGPYYNDSYYKMKKEVPGVVETMKNLSRSAPEKEQQLVHTMEQRYSNDLTNADRQQLDSNYANALHELKTLYKNDNEIAALYVDAMMLQHKWDFWSNDGNPKPWTTDLVKSCEAILKKDPLHPAALHYYIHLTEASKHPGVSLHSADLLKDEMTGAGHMVIEKTWLPTRRMGGHC